MNYTLSSPLRSLGQAPASTIQAWITKHNASAPTDFAATLVNQCSQAGLNADLCAAQVMHETGWLTSDWFVNHRNPAGVGVTGQPGVGSTFPTIEAGIHAYLAHLLTYCLGSANPWKADDPRYQAAISAGYGGTVTTVGGLGGTWAVPGTTYGQSLVTLANDLISTIGAQSVAQTDDSAAVWSPSSNFDAGRGGVTIDRIILHTTEGGYLGSLHWLQGQPASSNTDSSAHYIVDANGGQLAQLVHEADTAWAAGVYSWNQRSINIEQEGWAAKGNFSDGLYQTVGALVGRIARRHNIPLDRQHVIGHMDVPRPNDHTDPGPQYDFDRVLAIAKGGQPAAPASDQPRWFPETRHYIAHGFKAFYESHSDALMLFGYPLSEEFTDASGTVVQWFERARFEWHPGSHQNDWDVLLGRLGADAMANDRSQFPAAFADAEPPK